MKWAIGLSLLLSLTIIMLGIALISAEPFPVIIEVYPDGWCTVNLEIAVEEPLVGIPLLGQPTSVTVIDEEGLPLNYTIENGSLLVEAVGASRINVTYETQSLTSKEGLVWSLNVSAPLNWTVVVRLMDKPDVVGISKPPIRISENSYLELTFTPPFSLDYVYTSPIHADENGLSPYLLLLLALVPFMLTVPLYIIFRRRGGKKREVKLDSTDVSILKSLVDGEKSLSELREELSLPKTTAWRRVKRLSEEGLLEMEKTGSGSVIRLTKRGRKVLDRLN